MLDVKHFEHNLDKYKTAIFKLLANKYGITADEFMIKTLNAIKKNPNLLKCSPSSLFGSILYFAEIGLPFNTPEGFGTILPFSNKGVLEATPIIGYKGIIEIAYRNPKMKSIKIQAVYDEDEFDFQYGTTEYLIHKPNLFPSPNKKLIAVYAIAKIEGIDPVFVVVNKPDLDKIEKLSKSNGAYSAYNNGLDVFNIMQSKVAIKLLFKTLPKTNNEYLMNVLENDNHLDYSGDVKVVAKENGYEIVDSSIQEGDFIEKKKTDLNIEIEVSKKFEEKQPVVEQGQNLLIKDEGRIFEEITLPINEEKELQNLKETNTFADNLKRQDIEIIEPIDLTNLIPKEWK